MQYCYLADRSLRCAARLTRTAAFNGHFCVSLMLDAALWLVWSLVPERPTSSDTTNHVILGLLKRVSRTGSRGGESQFVMRHEGSEPRSADYLRFIPFFTYDFFEPCVLEWRVQSATRRPTRCTTTHYPPHSLNHLPLTHRTPTPQTDRGTGSDGTNAGLGGPTWRLHRRGPLRSREGVRCVRHHTRSVRSLSRGKRYEAIALR
jgi:hypothetical protein